MLTLPGSKQISRTAAGFATALGCGEMVADSAKQFEDDAVRLGSSFRRPPPSELPRRISQRIGRAVAAAHGGTPKRELGCAPCTSGKGPKNGSFV
eukprot:COSAG01_NODE_4128_length_5325_cov_4.201493_9_plen_95_part_00